MRTHRCPGWVRVSGGGGGGGGHQRALRCLAHAAGQQPQVWVWGGLDGVRCACCCSGRLGFQDCRGGAGGGRGAGWCVVYATRAVPPPGRVRVSFLVDGGCLGGVGGGGVGGGGNTCEVFAVSAR